NLRRGQRRAEEKEEKRARLCSWRASLRWANVSEQPLQSQLEDAANTWQGTEIGIGIGAGREIAFIAQIVHIQVRFPHIPLREGRGIESNISGKDDGIRDRLLGMADIGAAEGRAPHTPALPVAGPG